MALSRYLASGAMAFRFVVANRTQYFLQVIGELIPVVAMTFVWKVAYTQAPTIGGLDQSQMLTYLFVAQFFRILASHSANEWQMGYWIRTGDLVRQLIQPLRFLWNDFSRGLGWLVAVGGLSGGLLLLIGALFFGVGAPPLASLPALVFSLFFSLTISYSLSYFIGGLAFWTEGATWGLSSTKGVLLAFAGGALIPLSLFPEGLRSVINVLPFQATVHTPAAIWLGQMAGLAAWQAVGVQALWAAALLFLADRFFQYSLRKVTIPGG